MATGQGYRFDYNQFTVQEIRNSRMLVPDLVTICERAKTLAIAMAAAEKGTGTFETGHYAESFEVVVNGTNVMLSNSDYKANWIEYGTLPLPPYKPEIAHHIMKRAFEAQGLFTSGGKQVNTK